MPAIVWFPAADLLVGEMQAPEPMMPEQDLQDAVERPSEIEELIAELEAYWTYDAWFTGWYRRPPHSGVALLMAEVD